MKQYISKTALVAEIEKEIKHIYAGREYVGISLSEENRVYGLQMAKDIIDTLEVKEVGLDLGSPNGDMGVKTIWDGEKIVSSKAQKGE